MDKDLRQSVAAQTRERVAELYHQGLGYRRISRLTNLSRTRVRKILLGDQTIPQVPQDLDGLREELVASYPAGLVDRALARAWAYGCSMLAITGYPELRPRVEALRPLALQWLQSFEEKG